MLDPRAFVPAEALDVARADGQPEVERELVAVEGLGLAPRGFALLLGRNRGGGSLEERGDLPEGALPAHPEKPRGNPFAVVEEDEPALLPVGLEEEEVVVAPLLERLADFGPARLEVLGADAGPEVRGDPERVVVERDVAPERARHRAPGAAEVGVGLLQFGAELLGGDLGRIGGLENLEAGVAIERERALFRDGARGQREGEGQGGEEEGPLHGSISG